MDAMAEELFRITVDGERNWDEATPELRQDFRGYIDSLIDRARQAESERVSTEQ